MVNVDSGKAQAKMPEANIKTVTKIMAQIRINKSEHSVANLRANSNVIEERDIPEEQQSAPSWKLLYPRSWGTTLTMTPFRSKKSLNLLKLTIQERL